MKTVNCLSNYDRLFTSKKGLLLRGRGVSRVIERNQETAEKSDDSICMIVHGIYRRQNWKE